MGDDDKTRYPCADEDCDVMRTKAEGGTVFTVCDKHWHAFFQAADNPTPPEHTGDRVA